MPSDREAAGERSEGRADGRGPLSRRRPLWYGEVMAILARDVMKTTVVSVHPDTPLAELEDTLIARRISGAPVLEHGHLVGIVSRSDIVRYFTLQRSMAALLHPPKTDEGEPAPEESWQSAERHLRVKDIMARDTVVVAPDTPISEVARLMVSRHVHRVLVTESDAVVGLISALDLAQIVAEEKVGNR
jgi:CBS domain-containing protein